MRQVIIRNLTKQMKIFVLPHQIVCVKGGRCLCRNGSPASVHVPALRRTAPLPGAVCEAPDIKRALAKKEIAILAAPTKAEPKKAAPKNKKDEPRYATDKTTRARRSSKPQTTPGNRVNMEEKDGID